MEEKKIKVALARDLLQKNKTLAVDLRTRFARQGLTVINLMGSPGAGKTTLLEASLPLLCRHYRVGVIEGDLYTTRDAERLAKSGVAVIQINTEGACHLDAHLVGGVLEELPELDLLLIENVGNLVCPVGFDLGEDARAVVLSISEGDDKPEKYPQTFRTAHAVILSKLDLLPYVSYDLTAVLVTLAHLNPAATVMQLSAIEESSLTPWLEWVESVVAKKKRGR
ncbi:MAG: Hydrogenase isoenzymes nickel incorporation protein HypB [Firmicutes bacterium]|nr:Hydrogenase isoenzymes nickel incorporation protein HypB [Bacillota bacterium]